MSTHTINITGVSSGVSPQSSPPTRRPIFDVVNDSKTFSLLVQALTLMQAADQNQAASHFQVGGIHGQPFVEWDGSGGATSASQDWPGYCTHGTVNFPTWHRPYVALYEQILQAYMVQVADTYTTSDKIDWQNTAANFRLPYWDWASNSVPPPQVLSQQEVDIVVADGSTQTVTNSLYSYQFHPVSQADFDEPWNQWQTTLRCPTDETADAQSDPQQVTTNLTGSRGTIAYQLKHSTYILLTQINNWINMSNHSQDINSDYASSLEAIHDKIHSYVGGDTNGHMGVPAVAAHDPIFFLHHCNVDRIFALWQAIHYQSFVPKSTAEDGTWVYPAGSAIDETTPLAPFWKDANSYWSSDGIRDFTVLGYTYPEFAGLDLSDHAAVKQAITAKVNALYGQTFIRPRPRILSALSSILHSTKASEQQPAKEPPTKSAESPAHPPAAPSAPVAAFVKPPAGSSNPEQGPLIPAGNPGADEDDGQMVDWRVRVLAPKYKLGGPYSVFIFLGSVPDIPSQWRAAESLVGTVEVFANTKMGNCENCRTHSDLVVEGVVFLNHALAMSPLESFEPHVVAEYLKNNLHWRVLKKGQVIDIPRDLPELKVSVVEVPIHFKPGDSVPHRTGDVNHHPTITAGRDGGAS